MKDTKTNKKKIKLQLNKQTIVHLSPGQMARLGGGNDKQSDDGTCNTFHCGKNFQSQQCPTYDTGIPPYGQRNRTVQ